MATTDSTTKGSSMNKLCRYIVHYGDNSRMIIAPEDEDAIEIVRNEYEAEWGVGAFDQYEISYEVVPDEDIA